MVEKLRIPISRIFVCLLIVFICVSGNLWKDKSQIVTTILFLLGVALVGIATLGRLWCSVYIAGYKTDHLVTQGPYSMCRNPLYFFSLLGALGVGFFSETFSIPLVIIIAFSVYYLFVIKSEEAELTKLHKSEFEIYLKKVPRFLPKSSLLNEPEKYLVRPIVIRRHMFDALWFIWFLGIFKLIETFRELKVLPTIFKIY